MSVAGRRIWGDGNLARYGNKKSPASTSSCDGGSWEVGGWRLESAFWISLSVPAMAVGSRACIRSRVGRQERSGCSGCGGCGGCDGCSWGALDHSRSSGLPVSQKQCADASLFLFPHVAADSVATCSHYCTVLPSQVQKDSPSRRFTAQHSALSIEGSRQITCDLLPQ